MGGIKDKVIAAHRAGIRSLILPLWNEKDMEDVPEHIKSTMTFYFTDKMKDVINKALEEKK